jgi:phosphate transport system permease protein
MTMEGRTRTRLTPENVYRKTILFSSILIVLLITGMFLTIAWQSFPSLGEFGFRFITGTTWDPVAGEFGALPFIAGTLITSFLAILISTPFSIAIAIFLGEYYREGYFSSFLRSTIELLAGIPSIIYGFWGLFVLTPLIRELETFAGAAPYGVGILTASLILSIMIIPYSASLAREVICLVPAEIKEASYSLGATRFEVIRKIVLPYVRSGIVAGILLSLGRALGETMAVTMVIGNSNFMPKSLFDPGNTMASLIANEFTEATEKIYISSLIEIGLLLFVITAVINISGKYIIRKLGAYQ